MTAVVWVLGWAAITAATCLVAWRAGTRVGQRLWRMDHPS